MRSLLASLLFGASALFAGAAELPVADPSYYELINQNGLLGSSFESVALLPTGNSVVHLWQVSGTLPLPGLTRVWRSFASVTDGEGHSLTAYHSIGAGRIPDVATNGTVALLVNESVPCTHSYVCSGQFIQILKLNLATLQESVVMTIGSGYGEQADARIVFSGGDFVVVWTVTNGQGKREQNLTRLDESGQVITTTPLSPIDRPVKVLLMSGRLLLLTGSTSSEPFLHAQWIDDDVSTPIDLGVRNEYQLLSNGETFAVISQVDGRSNVRLYDQFLQAIGATLGMVVSDAFWDGRDYVLVGYGRNQYTVYRIKDGTGVASSEVVPWDNLSRLKGYEAGKYWYYVMEPLRDGYRVRVSSSPTPTLSSASGGEAISRHAFGQAGVRIVAANDVIATAFDSAILDNEGNLVPITRFSRVARNGRPLDGSGIVLPGLSQVSAIASIADTYLVVASGRAAIITAPPAGALSVQALDLPSLTQQTIVPVGSTFLVLGVSEGQIRGLRVSPSGVVMDGGDFPVISSSAIQSWPRAAWDGTELRMVYGERFMSGGQLTDAAFMTVRLRSDGRATSTPLRLTPQILPPAETRFERRADIVWNGSVYVAMWSVSDGVHGARFRFAQDSTELLASGEPVVSLAAGPSSLNLRLAISRGRVALQVSGFPGSEIRTGLLSEEAIRKPAMTLVASSVNDFEVTSEPAGRLVFAYSRHTITTIEGDWNHSVLRFFNFRESPVRRGSSGKLSDSSSLFNFPVGFRLASAASAIARGE